MSHHHEDSHAQSFLVFSVLFCPVLARFCSGGFCVFCYLALSVEGELSNFFAFAQYLEVISMGMKNRKGSRFFLIFKRHVGENMRTCKYQFSSASVNSKKTT